MYDRHLDTFIQVADSGSFLKASERIFISANPITQQINLPAARWEVKQPPGAGPNRRGAAHLQRGKETDPPVQRSAAQGS